MLKNYDYIVSSTLFQAAIVFMLMAGMGHQVFCLFFLCCCLQKALSIPLVIHSSPLHEYQSKHSQHLTYSSQIQYGHPRGYFDDILLKVNQRRLKLFEKLKQKKKPF